MMMNGVASGGIAGSTDVKYPPNVGRGLSAADIEVEKLYEPKQNKKIVRIFTVILYMFSVSLGAILLSLYYVFLWKNPHTKGVDQRVRSTILLIKRFENMSPAFLLSTKLGHNPASIIQTSFVFKSPITSIMNSKID